MRGLIVGYGSIGKRHIENLRRLVPDLELMVLRRQAAQSDATEIRWLCDLNEGLRERPAFAVIASPSSDHVETLIPLLRAGVPCYIEKPVATRVADLARLQDMLRKLQGEPVTLVGCNLRFLPSLRRLREVLLQGAIGRPVRATLQAGQWLPDWRPAADYRASYSADAQRGGGVIFDLIHELDAARWLFGEFDEVKAIAGRLSRLQIQTEDSAWILLGNKKGAPLTAVGLDYVARQPVRRYEIVGDEGTLTWDLNARSLQLVKPAGVESLDCGKGGFDVAATYVQAMTEFLDCVRSGRPSSQDLSEGLKSAALALCARESARL